ncbi:MAG: carbohydrate binding family 9 domain-containing protein [Gemmatimonadota bacterium]|nr:MAG: carbohydrate binding family 9 domain-containing protein [Gemmatimonadota bacterium]
MVWAAAAMVALCRPVAAVAQQTADGPDEPEAIATPAAEAAVRAGDIRIDGRPDELAWQNAEPVTEFVQGEPVENAPAEQPTEVRVLYDQSALYVSARMYDWQPGRIGAQLVRRDENGQYDYFELSLDPNSDRRTGYRFRVSAAGVQRDVYLHDDVREDEAWDAVWQSAVHHDSTGWSAELRIPLNQLRYNASDTVQSWGVNFSRRRLASNERTYFALESRVRHGKVSVFGRLNNLHFPRSARRLELRPYALASAHTAPAEIGDPFFDGSEWSQRAGLDLRYGLGASYTLDGTVNPDFGQVEVDPAVINLTQFETFFPEKRPFFVEDARIFDYRLGGRSDQLFYSRRIGREPRGSEPDDVDFVQAPTETTILTAAKVTGKSAGGLSLGALAAITDKESGRSYNTEAGETVEFTAEPAGQYGVFRAQQDFRGGASQLGGIFTVAHRNLPNDGSFDYLTSNAYSLGIDFDHSWGGPGSRDWALSGHFAGTYVRGSTTALIDVQESSNHYFQRPDATRFSVDSAATSMSGVNWRLEFERQSGVHWTGSVWIGEITPGFEANDLGFIRSSERLDAGLRLSYHEISPGALFRSYRATFSTSQNWRHEALDDVLSWNSWQRAHKAGTVSLRTDFEFLNYWELELDGRYSPEVLSDSKARGGPLMTNPGSTELELSLHTDPRQPFAIRPRLEYEDGQRGGYRLQTGLGVTIRPSPTLEIHFAPEYSRGLDPAQYVTSEDDATFEPTYGARYLFSDLRRHEFSLDTRLNVAFNPRLTLQFYAQPLISSGNYRTYKQLERPESFDFDVFEEGTAVIDGEDVSCAGGRTCERDGERYIDWDGDGVVDTSFDDEDFNIRSLRLNAVLRWEYRPGSTIFLVWQQNRRDRVNDGSFDLGSDLDALRSLDTENVFIIKVNYWLGL